MSKKKPLENNLHNRIKAGVELFFNVCGNCQHYKWSDDFDREKGTCLKTPEPKFSSISKKNEFLPALTQSGISRCEFFKNINKI